MATIWEMLENGERERLTNMMPKNWRPPDGKEETPNTKSLPIRHRVRKVERDRVCTSGSLGKD